MAYDIAAITCALRVYAGSVAFSGRYAAADQPAILDCSINSFLFLNSTLVAVCTLSGRLCYDGRLAPYLHRTRRLLSRYHRKQRDSLCPNEQAAESHRTLVIRARADKCFRCTLFNDVACPASRPRNNKKAKGTP